MVKAAKILHTGVQRLFARMAEGGVAKIMGESQRFCQILIQMQGAGNGTRDLRHFDRMGESGSEMVALMMHKDLGFMFHPAKSGAMDNPVPVTLEY